MKDRNKSDNVGHSGPWTTPDEERSDDPEPADDRDRAHTSHLTVSVPYVGPASADVDADLSDHSSLSRRGLSPTATTSMQLLPAASGEKNRSTSSS